MTDVVTVGRVGRPHGLDGAFVVENASEDPSRFSVGAVIYVDGAPGKVVVSRRVGGGRRAIRLDREVSRGQELTVRVEDLAAPETDTYYVFQLVGLRAVSPDGVNHGHVKDVLPGIANDNLELDDGTLVPMIEDAILEVDLDGGTIILNSAFTD